MPTPRRHVLIGAAAIAAYFAARPLARRYWPAGELEFSPATEAEGFRWMKGGEITASADPLFVGLERDDGGDDAAMVARVRGDLCAALYAGLPRDVVPVASFSDYFCSVCRVTTVELAKRAADPGAGFAVRWHELPLLGQASSFAARAALAADMQGGYAAFQERLLQTALVPTSPYLRRLAGDLGLDSDRLLADMESQKVDQRLRETSALARVFGFIGTPALVVGRTLVLGKLRMVEFERLVERERADGPFC